MHSLGNITNDVVSEMLQSVRYHAQKEDTDSHYGYLYCVYFLESFISFILFHELQHHGDDDHNDEPMRRDDKTSSLERKIKTFENNCINYIVLVCVNTIFLCFEMMTVYGTRSSRRARLAAKTSQSFIVLCREGIHQRGI